MTGKEQESQPKVSVVDRRHWVKEDGGEGTDPQAPSLQPTYIEKLEDRSREQEECLKEFVEKQQAENEAFRERIRKDAERRAEDSMAALVGEFVAVLDDLDRALQSGRQAENPDSAGVLDGIEMVKDRLAGLLRTHGLETVECKGAPFDPNVHEAVSVVSVEDPEMENRVVEEVLPGYLLKGRLLRPARVNVAQPTPPSHNEDISVSPDHQEG